MHIIVGSSCMSYWGIKTRIPSDLDVWTDGDYSGKGDVCILPTTLLSLVDVADGYATLDSLYTIKLSHLGWDIFWEKHKKDAITLKNYGCKIIEPLYDTLLEYWKEQHGNKDFLSLYKDKTEFFNDHVEYVYDHDYLHHIVSSPFLPIYTKCLKDGEDVAINKEKFYALPFEEQLRMFREEITVIAIERWLLPEKVRGKISWIEAYKYALRKTTTQLTKNWATDFIVKNIEILNKPEYSLFENAFKQLKEGECFMSKVDMSVFEELFPYFDGTDMDEIIWDLASGDLDYLKYSDDFKDYKKTKDEFIKKYQYVHHEQEGGGEGGAEYCYGIFSLMGKTYKAEWQCFSYHGYETDGCADSLREVKPVEKTVVVWE